MIAPVLGIVAAALTYQGDTTYAFMNVSVIPMSSEVVLADQTVLVREGRVAAVGQTGTVFVPIGTVLIDGRDKFLMPGLAEMHAHIPQEREAAEEVLFLYASAGVTTIRGMLGHPMHLQLRHEVAEGRVLGPRIWTSSPSVNGRSVPTPAAADSAARAAKAAGYDFIKVHPGPTWAAFSQLDATADEVGIPFSGHVPAAVGLLRALDAKYASIDHLDQYIEALVSDDPPSAALEGGWFGANIAMSADETRIPHVARLTKEAGVWNVPTQTLAVSYATTETAESMARRWELQYVSPRTRERWIGWKNNADSSGPDAATLTRYVELRQKLIKALHDEGAGLLLGSDAPQVWNVPGFAVWRELETIVDAGLTPYEALRTGTVNVAEFFGVEEEQGTVEAGKRADLILLDSNPLLDIPEVGVPAGVMLHGRWLSSEEVTAHLTAIAEKYRS